ncbi:MAG TPA: NUDIX domain-containing protein [Candidatus Saccharibacteria bacterium]|nr:NUDIX domain-containing protein [Candidatus Saccharibacteria bacterium]
MSHQPYKADAHKAQMAILRRLLIEGTVSFSDLVREAKLTSDHGNFHIKKLITAGMVERVPKSYGKYRLTRKGKEYANRMDTDELVIEKQPKLVVDIGIEDGNGKFLFQERRKQPYSGYWGFPTGKIRWGETIVEAAARELMEETGLVATLRVIGAHHKLDYDENGEMLEDKYLILVHGTDPQGIMTAETETHTNHWLTPDEYRNIDKRFGDIDETLGYIRGSTAFITETKYQYESDAY